MAKTHSYGRKPTKPEYSAEKNLSNQMDAAVALYKSDMSLQRKRGGHPRRIRLRRISEPANGCGTGDENGGAGIPKKL